MSDTLDPRKRVLMIVYYYPPLGGIGALRTLKLAKYLPRLGWEPLVVTVSEKTIAPILCDRAEGELPHVTINRSYNPDLLFKLKRALGFDMTQRVALDLGAGGEHAIAMQRLKRFTRRLAANWMGIPDRMVDWYPFASREALRVCRDFQPSLIYSSAPPATCHLVAASVKRKTGLPWVADLRDPWSRKIDMPKSGTSLLVDRLLEKRTLRHADLLATVSVPILEQLRGDHPSVPKKVYLPNGFDEEDFHQARPITSEKLNILFTGTLFYPYRDPSPLLEAMQELRERGTDISGLVFEYAGKDGKAVEQLARRYGVQDNVRVLGQVSYRESIARQKGASAILYVQWEPLGELGHSGKLMESLGARRPILAINPTPGAADELIRGANVGEIARDASDVSAILERWLDEYILNGKLRYRGDDQVVSRYSYAQMVSQFADLFEDVSGNRRQIS